MCKTLFISERMEYLQNSKGLTLTQAYNQAKNEWENHRSNSCIYNYEEDHEEDDLNG